MKRRPRRAAVLALAILFCLEPRAVGAQAPEPPGAAPAPDLYFILDASGSMWGQVDGAAKIAIAKEVLGDLVRGLDDGSRVGLMVYGHRAKGDCRDIEEVAPPGPLDKRSLVARIRAIQPQGMTPITASIHTAAERLERGAAPTNIVLVSDGKETCQGDPCALVRSLKESGAPFVMYVIGFDVTAEERAQLECVATAGGGKYFAARSAGELKAALDSVVKASSAWGMLRIQAVKNGEPLRAQVEVYKAGSEELVFRDRSASSDADAGSRLEPGLYDVRITDEEVESRPGSVLEGVRIEAGKTCRRTVDFSGGDFVATVTIGGEPASAKVAVFQREGAEELEVASTNFGEENPKVTKLTPGTYDIVVKDMWRLQQEPEVRLEGVRIDPGARVEKTIEWKCGTLLGGATKDGKPHTASVEAFAPGTDERVANTDTSVENPAPLELLPGVYDIRIVDAWGDGAVKRFPGVLIEDRASRSLNAAF